MMNDLDFDGRTTLVVGGTSGIGNGIARRFRDAGAAVHVWATRAGAQDYDGDPGIDLEGMTYSQVDATDAAAVAAAAGTMGALDTLVLSQGTIRYTDEYEPDGFAHVLEVNVASLATVSIALREKLAAGGGSVVMISSMGSALALASAPAYCASKHAVTGLCQSLALAWASDGVRVNAVGPGVIPSRMAELITEDPDFLAAVLARNPMGRLGRAEEIADAVLFLASPMASYITGQTLLVDGGHTLSDIVAD